MSAAFAVEPPPDWEALRAANPDLKVLAVGPSAPEQVRGWADSVRFVPSYAQLGAEVQAMSRRRCVVLVAPSRGSWRTEPSPGCVVAPAAPTARRDSDLALGLFGVGYGGFVGAETGWLIGEVLEADEAAHTTEGVWPGMAGGAVIGGTTTWLLARSRDLPPRSERALYSGALQGTFYGAQIAQAALPLDAPARAERTQAAALAGSMLGVGAAVAAGERAPSVGDQWRVDLSSGIGWVTATGLSDLANLGIERGEVVDPRGRAGVALATTAAFGALGLVDARPGPGSIGLAVGQGAWVGAWSPLLFTDTPSARQVTGGARLGLGVGYAGALALSTLGEPDATSVGLQTAGWAAGSALGAGIPLAVARDDRAATVVGPMLAAGIAGQALGAALAPHYELGRGDALLLGTLGAWTTYQAVGWGAYASYTTDDARRPFGYALAAGGAGSLVTLGLLPALDVPAQGSVALLSGGGWGSWYGGWVGQLGGLTQEQAWLLTLGAGDAGLVGAGAAQALGWRPSYRELALIDGIGLVGAATGGLVGVVALYDPDDWDPMVASVLAGSTLGLATGAAWSATHAGDERRAGSSMRLPRVQLALSAVPLPGSDGSTGALVRLDGREAR